MEKVNCLGLALSFCLLFLNLFTSWSFAHHNPISPPVIYSCTPQFIQQGQITTSVVIGENLNSTVIGVSGGDVFALILKQDPEGKSLTIQFAVRPTAEPGERIFFLRNGQGQEASFPIKVIPSGSPVIESVYPNTSSPGSTLLLYITGKTLNNPIVTANSDQILINSFRQSSDGRVLYLSISLTPNIVPGVYQIYVNTIGGQVQADFIVSDTTIENTNSFEVDPLSPGIYSIEISPSEKNQVILKGVMFDPDPLNNIVTLIQNSDETVTSQQLEVISSNNSEILVSLPSGTNLDQISFAVSSTDGKSSNIKTINLNDLNTKEQTQENTSNNSDLQTGLNPIIQASGTIKQSGTTISGNTISNDNSKTPLSKDDPSQSQSGKQVDKLSDKGIDKNEKEEQGILSNEPAEDKNIIQNIQNISQYLFSSTTVEPQKALLETNLSEIKDPVKLISTIEEGKQIKSQVDLIMLALNEVKHDDDLQEVLKRAEALKSKVSELENLLTTEKQKNKPNLRKLAKYEHLLNTANAESRSQTFTLLNDLLKYKPQLKNLLTQKPFDLAAIQPNIPSNSVILQYVPTEEGLIIFVVDNKNLKTRIHKSISKDILNKEIQAYRQLFEKEIEKIKLTGRVTTINSWKEDKSTTYKKEIYPLKEKSTFLYNALISPIEKDIENKNLIVIIANGWLRYLPFQSLGKPTKDGDLKFLILDKSIVYLDSVIAISKNTSPKLNTSPTVAVLANPDGTLPGANKEAEIITMLFNKTTIGLVEKPFNVSLLNQLAKKTEILHLATHGYLDSANIDSSFLVSGKKLTNGKSIPEKLFLKDIYDLTLPNNKLVVLSGCDTGKLGSLSNEPDDILGSLASAFRVAGANTILASLSRAHDEATKLLMQSFYENIKLGLDKAEALRRAELKVKSNPQFGHPLFWSLFNLIGDWR